jgi:hypothetical protein
MALSCTLFAQPAHAQSQSDESSAFASFVASGQYNDANFYLANGYITAADIDTSQLFYTILSNQYFSSITANIRAIETLYNYLAAIAPIDLNRRFDCGWRLEETCLLTNDLVHGARPTEMAWFVARGLDLNKREPDIIPATLPLMLRFGTEYTLSDINWMTSNGMVLGDESYSIEELMAYEDRVISRYSDNLTLPDNFLNLGDQNFLDMLVVLLGTERSHSDRLESRRRDTLCQFITYAASAYTPSFDYLDFLMASVGDFRGSNIGRQMQADGGRYMPFPSSCAALIQAMAASHARLNLVVDRFAAQGDVQTASWLLSLMQTRK